MPKSATIDDYLGTLPAAQRELLDRLLPLIEAELPGRGALWHGHPVWSLGPAPGKSPVCLVKAHSGYVTFGFWRGQALSDTSGRLQPGAREMAAVKLRTPEDIDDALFTAWLRQARELTLAH